MRYMSYFTYGVWVIIRTMSGIERDVVMIHTVVTLRAGMDLAFSGGRRGGSVLAAVDTWSALWG